MLSEYVMSGYYITRLLLIALDSAKCLLLRDFSYSYVVSGINRFVKEF